MNTRLKKVNRFSYFFVTLIVLNLSASVMAEERHSIYLRVPRRLIQFESKLNRSTFHTLFTKPVRDYIQRLGRPLPRMCQKISVSPFKINCQLVREVGSIVILLGILSDDQSVRERVSQGIIHIGIYNHKKTQDRNENNDPVDDFRKFPVFIKGEWLGVAWDNAALAKTLDYSQDTSGYGQANLTLIRLLYELIFT